MSHLDRITRRSHWPLMLRYFLGQVAGILTFIVGLNLIYAALGFGISFIAFKMVISNLGFGLAATMSGITTLRISSRGMKRVTQDHELAEQEARHQAIRRAAFGNGNGGS